MKHDIEFFPRFGVHAFAPRDSQGLLIFLALLVVCGLAFDCRAAQVDWLYEAEVVVQGQGAAQRNRGINEAFGKVLVRVTGNKAVLQHAALAESLRKGDRYLQQYRYQNMPMPGQGAGLPETPQRLLKVSFDPVAINRVLRNKGLPVWGANRPAILVWLGIEENSRRRLAIPERDGSLWDTVREVARERGVPLLSPLLDLEDQSRLQVSDLWGDFESSIRQASDRYAPDAILAGRLVKRGRSWFGHWVLYADQTRAWESTGKTQSAAAVQGMELAIDHLASKYVPLAGDTAPTRLNLRIEDLHTLAAYGRVSTHLKSLDAVERAVLISVEPAAATFGLDVRGGRQALEQGIALGGLLEPLPEDAQAAVPLPSPGTTGSEPDKPGVSNLKYRVRP